MSLYVIDDHPLIREAVVMMLRRLRGGAKVIELDRLGGVESAVKANGTPELFCLDLKLPDTTGTSGIIELKRLFPETPLAVLSASPAADAEEQCIEAGADIYIEKSSGAGEIGNALRALLTALSYELKNAAPLANPADPERTLKVALRLLTAPSRDAAPPGARPRGSATCSSTWKAQAMS